MVRRVVCAEQRGKKTTTPVTASLGGKEALGEAMNADCMSALLTSDMGSDRAQAVTYPPTATF